MLTFSSDCCCCNCNRGHYPCNSLPPETTQFPWYIPSGSAQQHERGTFCTGFLLLISIDYCKPSKHSSDW
ncbi:hypothetical protein K438DRAFT_884723 [Mycena galopus ATCC 62051]|nr:hypothetical protein K438DRAFT_884723 [Mycena galopus ATCC 62051]